MKEDKLRKAIKISLKLREGKRLRGSKRSIKDAIKLARLARSIIEAMEKSGLIEFRKVNERLEITVQLEVHGQA